MSKIYYTADLHINDERIIDLCGRPFRGLKEMEVHLASNWNSTVTDSDKVIIVGDLACGNPNYLTKYLKTLNGRKNLITGNHDREWLTKNDAVLCFEKITTIDTISDRGRKVVLSHHPMYEYDSCGMNEYHVYGHIHNKTGGLFDSIRRQNNCYNAGVDENGFFPRTLDQLIERRATDESKN